MNKTQNVEADQVWYRKDDKETIYIKILETSFDEAVRYTAFAKWAWPERKRYPIDSTMKIKSLIASYFLATPIQIAKILKNQLIDGDETKKDDVAHHVTSLMTDLNKNVDYIAQRMQIHDRNFIETMDALHDKVNNLGADLSRLLKALGEPVS